LLVENLAYGQRDDDLSGTREEFLDFSQRVAGEIEADEKSLVTLFAHHHGLKGINVGTANLVGLLHLNWIPAFFQGEFAFLFPAPISPRTLSRCTARMVRGSPHTGRESRRSAHVRLAVHPAHEAMSAEQTFKGFFCFAAEAQLVEALAILATAEDCLFTPADVDRVNLMLRFDFEGSAPSTMFIETQSASTWMSQSG